MLRQERGSSCVSTPDEAVDAWLAATGRLRLFGSPKEHDLDLQIAAGYFKPSPALEITSKLARHTHKPWRATSRSSLSGLRGPNSLPTSDDKPCIRMMRSLLDRGCATIRLDVSTGFWVDLPFIAANVAQAMMRISSATRTSPTNSQHTARMVGTKKRQEQTFMKELGKATGSGIDTDVRRSGRLPIIYL